ncbi:MAG: inositol monophosphatase [bacterium]|nr:inositol monophosphatase [bacterium]
MQLQDITNALSQHMPPILRWAGGMAQQLRRFDIAVAGQKTSGDATTDALTLADLSVQELLVSALRDCDPIFRQCRLEAEESTGDLGCFASESKYIIALDPIDGTKRYQEGSGDGWCVTLNLRSVETVHYSLVYVPECGENGTWVEAVNNRIVCGDDDLSQPAADVLSALPAIDPGARPDSKNIYLGGFQQDDLSKAQLLTAGGLDGYPVDHLPGCMFELFARGAFGGTLVRTPNVYDFPVTLHMARILGGDALWVHNEEPVNFQNLWVDDRVDMVRLPGIIACSANRETLAMLCKLAKDWDPARYHDG